METTQQLFGPMDWLVLGGYFFGMVLVGAAVSRRQRDAEGFFLGGRNMPVWAVALSVLATSLSAATFIGAPQIAFAGNLTYLSTNIGGLIAAFIVAYCFIPPLYRAGTVTIYGYLGKRYGLPSMVAAGTMFLLGRLLASGSRLFIAGIGFALILYGDTAPGDLIFAIILLGFIGTLYTAFGGIRAVIWTDVIQIVVVVSAAALSIYLLLKAIPLSTGEIVDALRTAEGGSKLKLIDTDLSLAKPYTIWASVIAIAVFSTATYGVDHDLAQRMMTAKTPWRGGAALVASTAMSVPVVLMFMIIGLLLSIFYGRPDLMGEAAPLDVMDDSKRIYPQYLLHHFPAGLRGLSMAGLFAAAMSSFDSAINAMAATAVADVGLPWRAWRKGETLRVEEVGAIASVKTSRIMVVCMGILLTLFAVGAVYLQGQGNDTLINFALGVMSFALAPLLGVFSAAIFTQRGNTVSVYTALISGVLGVLLLQSYMLPQWCGFTLGWPWIPVIVSPFSFLICVMGAPQSGACGSVDS